MAAVNWTVETVEPSGRTKCMNPQQSGCWLFFFYCFLSLLFLQVFFLFFENSAPRHISLCGPEQHKQFSHSLLSCVLCFLSPYEILRSDAHQVATAAFLNGSCGRRASQEGGTRRRFGPGMLRKGEEGGETARGGTWSSGGAGEGLMPRMQTGREEEEEVVKEEVCGLIPLKALVLTAGSNYYQRARNKGSAWG